MKTQRSIVPVSDGTTHQLLLRAILLLIAATATLRADDADAQREALTALARFDPTATVDETQPGNPVVALAFRPNVARKLSDEDLSHVAKFSGLRSLDLPSQHIGNAGLLHLEPLADL